MISLIFIGMSFARGSENGFLEPDRGPLPIDLPTGVKDAISKAYGIPNVLIQNDYNMFYAPGTMMKYGTAYAEIWQGRPWGGATLKLPFGFKTAVFLGRTYNGFIYNNYGTTLSMLGYNFNFPNPSGNLTGVGATTAGAVSSPLDFSVGSSFPPQHSIDIMLGRKLGSKMAVGLKYSYFRNSQSNALRIYDGVTNKPDDGTMVNRKKYTENSISIGLTFDKIWIFNQLDFAIDFVNPNLRFDYNESMYSNLNFARLSMEATGGITMNILLRPIIKINEDSHLIVMLDYYSKDNSLEYSAQIDNTGDGAVTNHGFDTSAFFMSDDKTIGGMPLLALHTKPRDDLKIIYSTGLNMERRTVMYTESTWGTNDKVMEMTKSVFQFPVAVALEYEVVENLKLRMGFMKYLIDKRLTEVTSSPARLMNFAGTDSMEDSQDNLQSFSTTFGVGYRLKSFEVDLSMRVLSYTFDGLFTGASIKYHY